MNAAAIDRLVGQYDAGAISRRDFVFYFPDPDGIRVQLQDVSYRG